jgi:hypothetical protein
MLDEKIIETSDKLVNEYLEVSGKLGKDAVVKCYFIVEKKFIRKI